MFLKYDIGLKINFLASCVYIQVFTKTQYVCLSVRKVRRFKVADNKAVRQYPEPVLSTLYHDKPLLRPTTAVSSHHLVYLQLKVPTDFLDKILHSFVSPTYPNAAPIIS
jgi:hypothetical protein